MKEIKTIGFISELKRGNNSKYGNPTYYVEFVVDNDVLIGKTASNAKCGYTVEEHYWKLAEITYHITKNGNLIIDYVSGVKENDNII